MVPSGDTVHSRFMICLVSLFQYSLDKFDLVIINPRSSLIASGRQMGVDIAVSRGCDYVLFLDSDMIFPYTILDGLYSRQKGVVGATYVKRVLPTSWNHVELAGPPRVEDGLREVARLPLGATLIKLDTFDGWEKPYFRCSYENGTEGGEDYYFCDKVREQGDAVWLDGHLSKHIGHLGIHAYTYNDLEDTADGRSV